MKTSPMFLQLAGRTVVFAGISGETFCKLRPILPTGAYIVIYSPDPVADDVADVVATGRVTLHARWPKQADLTGAALVFVATGDVGRDAALTKLSLAAGALVDATKHATSCTTVTPILVDRDPLVTEADEPRGSITLVGAGPGARDLLTLRALRHLQEADVVYYDRLVDPGILKMAGRDAELVFVGKEVGGHSWPQSRIDAAIVGSAQQGRRVVRLKSGDPAIFGRAAEEFAAAHAAGIPVGMVPGVTAASAAAASLGRALTERGETEALVLVTGTCRPGDVDPDWGALARPGVTLALYMAVSKLAEIRVALQRAGVPDDSEVEIVMAASTAREACIRARLRDLGASDGRPVVAPALVLVRHKKTVVATYGVARVANDISLSERAAI